VRGNKDTRARRATPARSRAPRPLPERARPHLDAAAAPAGRQLRADRLDTAIREVAAKLVAIRDTQGGDKILYYGGGGQGNHLPGAFATATRAALGIRYASNALAQEKTGEFWVDGQLYGRPSCHTAPDFEHAEVAVFVGKNPWQSHGFPRARAVLREIARDPKRALVVIDPRRTETAELAEFHLQVRPGMDAFVLAALLAVLVGEELVDRRFVGDHTHGYEEVAAAVRDVPIADYCARAGVDEALVRAVARRIAAAESVSILEDLGIQQAPHSTLNSYLEKLVALLTGNFAKRGAINLHTHFGKLIGTSASERRTPVTGPAHHHRAGARQRDTRRDPDRSPGAAAGDVRRERQSGALARRQPAHAAGDRGARPGRRDRRRDDRDRAARPLRAAGVVAAREVGGDLLHARVPHNVVNLRAPLLDPTPGTLPEPEIHARLLRAMGALTDADLAPLRAAAEQGRAAFTAAFFQALANPKLASLVPVVLYETLGKVQLGSAAPAAVMWGLAHICARTYPESVRRAGFDGDPIAQGEALFEKIFTSRDGVVFSVDDYDETWRRVETADGKVRLAVPELLGELASLRDEVTQPRDPAFPFVLAAGERRTSTANTIFRDPEWRRKDGDGALRISAEDAARIGVTNGGLARVTTKRGSVVATVEVTETLQAGHVTLPNGLGLSYPDENGDPRVRGVAPNELTASEDRDWLAGTPWHKHVAARVEAIP
jgi:anaerobic selenocysteine-containing dehydrogenase